MRRIVIKVKDGKIDVKTQGFLGKSCLREMAKISKLTGLKLVSYQLTPEAYASVKARRVKA